MKPKPDTTTTTSPDELSLYYRNARRGDIPVIKASLRKHRQYKPLTGNIGTLTGRPYEVLAGNHTLIAIRELAAESDDPQWRSVKVHWGDWDEETCRTINLADNRTAELGGYDPAELVALLEDVPLLDLSSIGYTPEDLALLRQSLYVPDRHTDPDDAPPVPIEPVSEVGQIWQLGEHRLLVGSATDLAAVQQFCDGVCPDCVWTDPPYGVDYVGKTKDALRIHGDQAEHLTDLLVRAFTVARQVCRPGAPVYVAAPAGPLFAVFHSAMTSAGLLWRQILAWVKGSLVMGRSDYHYQHELVLYGFMPGGEGRLGRGGDRWFGDYAQTTVFEFPRPSRSAEHPTMKPVGLIDAMLANSLPPGGVVLDPFAGSGSTLIAAHGRGARCFAVEIDPRYADVILRRFEEHTTITPTLNGQPVSFLTAA